MPEIVFDTCVVSNFALSGRLTLIAELYPGEASITDFVGAEIIRGIHQGYDALRAVKAAVRNGSIREIHLSGNEEQMLFEDLSISLGCGEASCIAIAKVRGLTFASDDRAARREAARLGISLTGTLGILKKAVALKLLSAKNADALLAKMIESGFFTAVDSIREI